LAKPITLDSSEIWEVELCELSYSATQQLVNMAVITNAVVYCDLIAPQYIGSAMVRHLRTIKIVPPDYDSEYIFENVYDVPV